MSQTFINTISKVVFMKNFFTVAMIAFLPVFGQAQIGVGTTSLDATAMLQVNASASTNAKGFLGPRVALTSTSANAPFSVTPATGLMVYNTATAGSGVNEVTPGYYTYTGTGWERLAAPPTTFVGGTATGFPVTGGPTAYMYGTEWGWEPIGSIDLPPGRWEVIAEYTCVPADNYILGNENITSRENVYWLATNPTIASFPTGKYPLNLSGLTGGVGPTTDALFSGAAVSLQKVSSIEIDGGLIKTIHHYPKQSMKFYINNTGATSKPYYLHFHESIINSGEPFLDGQGFGYQGNSGENRLYAVRIN